MRPFGRKRAADLRPVHESERNPEKLEFISQEQYETSEADKKEKSHQLKKFFSYDPDEQDYINRAQMYKWDDAPNNQSDLSEFVEDCGQFLTAGSQHKCQVTNAEVQNILTNFHWTVLEILENQLGD